MSYCEIEIVSMDCFCIAHFLCSIIQFISLEKYFTLFEMKIHCKGDPLVCLDFFENAMAHPRMKVQVLGSLKLPLAKKNFGEKSVGKHDLFFHFFKSLESKVWTYLD